MAEFPSPSQSRHFRTHLARKSEFSQSIHVLTNCDTNTGVFSTLKNACATFEMVLLLLVNQ
jgi:hypothetical protein